MSKYMRLFLASVCFLAVAYKIQAADNQNQHNHLECWHCSSETKGAENFCGVTFDEDSIPVEPLKERNISVKRSCNSTINSDHERAVCRKTVEEVNGKTITKRFCYYTNKSNSLDHCNEKSIENNINRVFCEDCLTDRCNSATQVAAIMCTILLPIIVAKIVWI